MTCVFPVHAGDVFLLLNLLRWIKQLGGCAGHSALIVADDAMPFDQCRVASDLAADSFDNVQFITNGKAVAGWIPGSNSLWLAAAKHCSELGIEGWLWLEPDAVPLRAGWLDALEHAWQGTVSDFLACRYSCTRPDCPPAMMSGIAVYPDTAFIFYKPVAEAFDIQLSRTAIDFVEHTPLIQHLWGQPGLPPTFRATFKGAPRHAFGLGKLDPAAVLFHRNKDGTLIDLLRAQLPQPSAAPKSDAGGSILNPQLLVVLPVCVKDADLMIKCLDWMVELDSQNQFDCLIAHDPTLGPAWLSRLRPAAQRAFRQVNEFVYPRPVRENWPDAADTAFQATAQHIQAVHHRPWFWFEADCVPLKPGWLPSLWLEYQNCGQPIMGSVVPGMGHINGTAIYPPNFANLSPRAMAAGGGTAWDTDMTPDLVGRTHDCSRSFFHAWGQAADGSLHPCSGPPPHFGSTLAVDKWIPRDAVLFHRCKDGSLIDQLRAKKRAP